MPAVGRHTLLSSGQACFGMLLYGMLCGPAVAPADFVLWGAVQKMVERYYVENGMLFPSYTIAYWIGLRAAAWPRCAGSPESISGLMQACTAAAVVQAAPLPCSGGSLLVDLPQQVLQQELLEMRLLFKSP